MISPDVHQAMLSARATYVDRAEMLAGAKRMLAKYQPAAPVDDEELGSFVALHWHSVATDRLVPTPPAQRRLVVRSHADRLASLVEKPVPIIDGLIYEGEVACIIASPGVGKTATAIQMCESVANGTPFLGRKTTKGAILYCCPDAEYSCEMRFTALSESTNQNIYSVITGCAQDGSDAFPQFPDELYLIADHIKAARQGGIRYRMLVVDTFDAARSHDAGDGYSAQDRAFELCFRELRRLARDLSIGILIIHHSTKSNEASPRGSGVMKARLDALFMVEHETPDDPACKVAVLKAIKLRDGELGEIGKFHKSAKPDMHGKARAYYVPASGGGATDPAATRVAPHPLAERVMRLISDNGRADPEWLAVHGMEEADARECVKRLTDAGWLRTDRKKVKVTPEGNRALLDLVSLAAKRQSNPNPDEDAFNT
jgi:hypothetical protein